jgi:hypothetical protein
MAASHSLMLLVVDITAPMELYWSCMLGRFIEPIIRYVDLKMLFSCTRVLPLWLRVAPHTTQRITTQHNTTHVFCYLMQTLSIEFCPSTTQRHLLASTTLQAFGSLIAHWGMRARVLAHTDTHTHTLQHTHTREFVLSHNAMPYCCD